MTATIPTAISVSVRCSRHPTQITTPPPREPARAGSARSRGRRGRSPRGRPRAPPTRVVDVAVRAHEQRRLPLGVRLADHVVHRRDGRGVRARSGEQAMAREDLVDRRRRASVRAWERITRWSQTRSRSARMCDERTTVISPLARPTSITRVHELAPCQRIERGHGLVEDQQLGPLRERERERDLRLLAARELPDLAVEGQAETLDARAAPVVVPARVEPRPSFRISRDAEPAMQGMVLRDERRRAAARRSRSSRGRGPSTCSAPVVGLAQPDRELQQRRLAGAVRADERRHRSRRDRRACSRGAPRSSRSACRARVRRGLSRRSCDPRDRSAAGACRRRAPRCASSSSPAARARVDPALESPSEAP